VTAALRCRPWWWTVSCSSLSDNRRFRNRPSSAARTDTTSNRKLLGKLLAVCGVQSVEFAEDGVIALDKVATHREVNHFQLILLDNVMPNMVW
jgi:PleD family two-component response regulator